MTVPDCEVEIGGASGFDGSSRIIRLRYGFSSSSWNAFHPLSDSKVNTSLLFSYLVYLGVVVWWYCNRQILQNYRPLSQPMYNKVIDNIRTAGIDNKIVLSKSDGIRSVGLYGRWWNRVSHSEKCETKTKKGLRKIFFDHHVTSSLLTHWYIDMSAHQSLANSIVSGSFKAFTKNYE